MAEEQGAGWRVALATTSIGLLGLMAAGALVSLPIFASIPFAAAGIGETSLVFVFSAAAVVVAGVYLLWALVSTIARKSPPRSGYDIVLLRVVFGLDLVLWVLILAITGLTPQVFVPYALGAALGTVTYFGVDRWRGLTSASSRRREAVR